MNKKKIITMTEVGDLEKEYKNQIADDKKHNDLNSNLTIFMIDENTNKSAIDPKCSCTCGVTSNCSGTGTAGNSLE
ncbi:hypothetical protein [Clostridium pasteurianum]|uniref:Uncharacterized protein n=1 Tax=Clostridium pasteurianum BC1 TaxID=86416 RepID=R4K9X2_CLOPA|nr:hypothetical protein [Clostridium pasteurianum]AGK96440.1 hypothetical protein Clopa_1491 [Clostridium pasteurianum BC1]